MTPERISRCQCPVVGFGQAGIIAPAHPSPWAVALTTSIVGAATGWLIEEVARGRRKKRTRRR